MNHWDDVYSTKRLDDVSWFEASPDTSLRLVLSEGVPTSVVDAGAGASVLVDHLIASGVQSALLLDLSETALAATVDRLGDGADRVTTLAGDILDWQPQRTYDVWHDRAVFHFLTHDSDRERYVDTVRSAVRPGGLVVVGTFALDGPEQCSGLPTCRYDAEGLSAKFGPGFSRVHAEPLEHRTPWGSSQSFTWVVLRRE